MKKPYILKLVRSAIVQAKYDEVKKRIYETNYCPFCRLNRKINKIIEETENCLVFLNAYPYEDTEYHYQIIPKEHIELADEASLKIQKELMQLICKYLVKPKSILLCRGDKEPAKTVSHLHFHILSFRCDKF